MDRDLTRLLLFTFQQCVDRRKRVEIVRDLHERAGLTVLMVSHALNEVANYVARIALLVEGKLRIGPVEEVLTEGALSELYRIPVEVASFEGHRIVLARHHRGTNHA